MYPDGDHGVALFRLSGPTFAFQFTSWGEVGDDPNSVLSTYAHLLPRSDEQAAER